jgi:2-polyprenyl-6-methoxyphenol hydroxylase-like FAD-dependent oxidoreductase
MMIAISGGGIAGLAAALAVLRAGHDALLIAGTEQTPLLGGVQIAPNGWAALDELGLADDLRNAATNLCEINVRDLVTGATLTRVELVGPYVSLTRSDIAKTISEALALEPSFQRIDAKISHVVQVSPQHGADVKLLLDNGQILRVDALVAADGVSGLGRRYVTSHDIDTPGRKRPHDRIAMRSVIETGSSFPRFFTQHHSNLWLGNGAHIVHYPLEHGNRVNIVVTLNPSEANASWKERLLGSNEILASLIALPEIKWAKTVIPSERFEPCWRRGRVVLAGDSAHPMPPNLAQGAGQSLEDAACLLRWLSKSRSIDVALSGYVRERTSTVGRIFNKARTSSRIMAMGGTSANLRNMAFGLGGSNLLNNWLSDVWNSHR